MNNKLLISESAYEDYDESFLELLWNQGLIVSPLGVTPAAALLPPHGDVGPSSEPLRSEQDEMAMWLEDGYDEGDQIDEMAKMTSTRASRSIRAEEEVVTTTTAAPTVPTVDDEDDDACTVFEVGSVRDSVVHTTSSTEQTATGQRKKRKARSGKELESDSQDAGIELGNKRKDSRQSASTRTRASEVHNLSERRRRDRINEKMKILQELIPRCNKSDKASTLDNAIEYLKSLQLQVQECKVRSHRREKHQMMSYMQYNMGQMMFPGAPRYLQPVGFPMGGMPYPIMPVGPMPPYPPNVESSASNLCPQLLPSLHQYPASSSINTISSSMAQVPNFAAPRYAAVLVPYQGQTLAEPGTSKEANNAKRSTDGFKIH